MKSKNELKETKGLSSGDKSDGLGAKGVSGFSPAQIQQVKDFVWDKMEDASKSLLLEICALPPDTRREYYVRRILFRMEGRNKDGHFEEVFIISPEYNLVQFPSEKAYT